MPGNARGNRKRHIYDVITGMRREIRRGAFCQREKTIILIRICCLPAFDNIFLDNYDIVVDFLTTL